MRNNRDNLSKVQVDNIKQLPEPWATIAFFGVLAVVAILPILGFMFYI